MNRLRLFSALADRKTARRAKHLRHRVKTSRIELLEPRLPLAGDLVISEFMAINRSTLADDEGDFPDWIEIRNTTAATIDLDGWYLTDDEVQLDRWRLPEVDLGAGQQLVVFASDKDRTDPAATLHTNFKLSGSGEFLALVRPDGVTVEFQYAPQYPPQIGDVSYGLSLDQNSEGFFLSPTPGGANGQQPVSDPTQRLIFSEIMYHPASENSAEEYLELWNRGSVTVNLDGWQISSGVQYTFGDVDIGPNERLVVAADLATFSGKYPAVSNVVGGWSGRLSNRGETVELSDSSGQSIDQVSYFDEGDWGQRERGPLDDGHRGWTWSAGHDGLGRSLELVNAELSNDHGQNWAASQIDEGTPGAVNSVATSNTAPLILDVAHAPIIPRSVDSVTVTARVLDSPASGITVSLFWRLDGAANFSATTMFDDGNHGDKAPGDGLYGAILPPQADDAVVEFYVRATDSQANIRTWPAPTQPANRQLANALYQVDDSIDPDNLPTYRIIMTADERSEFAGINRSSNAQMNATFISSIGGQVQIRYNAGVRIRGSGSRGNNPPNNRVNIPSDRIWHGVDAFNINVVNPRNQIAGSLLYAMAAMPAADAIPVRLLNNGNDLNGGSYYAHVETLNSDFVSNHFPLDDGGNLYKGRRSNESPPGGQGAGLQYRGTDPTPYFSYVKQSNASEADWSDVIDLTFRLNELPNGSYLDDIAPAVNTEWWLRSFAINTLIGNREGGLFTGDSQGDDYAMYRGVSDPRFVMIPHDLDTLFSGTSGSIFRTDGVPALNRFLNQPSIEAAYYEQLHDLIDNILQPEQIRPMLELVLGNVTSASSIDNIVSYLQNRAAYVKSIIPGPAARPPHVSQPSDVPQSALGDLWISEVVAANQTAVDHQGTFPDMIELFNSGVSTIDLTGMSLSDDPLRPDRFIFPEGVSILSGERLVLFADDAATSGLHLGFSLKDQGEGVYLFDTTANGRSLLDQVEFGSQIADLSIGVDNQGNWVLTRPTFGTANQTQPTGDRTELRLNEWLAAGDQLLGDDFVEIHNPESLPVALADLYLTDNPNGDPSQSQIAPLSFIAAGGFTLFTADADPEAGADHVDFRLSILNEMIGLMDENGKRIDVVVYSGQRQDISTGRNGNGTQGFVSFDPPTPGTSNPGIATNTTSLIGITDSWRYEQSGNDLGTAWRAAGHDDGAWPTGPALLYREASALPAPKSTELTLNDANATYYFRTHFNLDADPADVESLILTHVIDDGAIFYLNGQEIFRWRMPSGAIEFTTPATQNVGNAVFVGPFDLPTDLLVEGDNVLAVEVHQSTSQLGNPGAGDLVMGLTLDVVVSETPGSTPVDVKDLLDDLRITELMYDPAGGGDHEFLEFQNTGSTMLNLDGVRLTRGVQFTFPALVLAPGERVVVVKNASAFETRYGTGPRIAGQFAGSLSNGGENIELRLPTPFIAKIHDFTYDDVWYPQTDGDGFSLVVVAPLGDTSQWDRAVGWRPSRFVEGSPGAAQETLSPSTVVISEILSNTDTPEGDWIELHNQTAAAIDISGWFLSNDPLLLTKYELPAGSIIAAADYLVFTAAAHFGTSGNAGVNVAFALDTLGDSVRLTAPASLGVVGGYRDVVVFGATENGVSLGRHVNSQGQIEMEPLVATTQGAVNSARIDPAVVINEVMYNPASGELEFIELINRSEEVVPLYDPLNPSNPWRIDAGFTFDFPPAAEIPADTVALVVPTDPELFRARYEIDLSVSIFGPYTGGLSNAGERIELLRPAAPEPDLTVAYVRVDHLVYHDDSPWPKEADGQGKSLVRFDAIAFGNDPENWQPSNVGGSPGVLNPVIDTTPPSVPTDLVAAVTAVDRIELAWQPAIDPQSGVTVYHVYRDDVEIGTSVGTTFVDTPVAANTTYRYEVSAENGEQLEGLRSDPINVSVITLISAALTDSTHVQLSFSQTLQTTSAETTANYSIGGVAVFAAALGGDGQTVTLTTSPLSNGVTYLLSVGNLLGTQGSQLPPDTLASFTLTPRVSDGLLVLYDLDEGSGTTVYDISGFGTPLDLEIANINNVTWIDGGLSIDAATIIASQGAATKLFGAITQTAAITIEAWISPANTSQIGPSRIVTMSADDSNRNFMLAQDGDRYTGRLRTTSTSDNGTGPSLTMPRGTLDAQLSHVVYTHNAAGTTLLYIDGVAVASRTIGGTLSNWNPSYGLALANELSGTDAWLGELHLIAIYDRALSSAQVRQNFDAGPGSSAPGTLGDFNDDGNVGLFDLAYMQTRLNSPESATLETGDLTGDAVVNRSDAVQLLGLFGGAAPSQSVAATWLPSASAALVSEVRGEAIVSILTSQHGATTFDTQMQSSQRLMRATRNVSIRERDEPAIRQRTQSIDRPSRCQLKTFAVRQSRVHETALLELVSERLRADPRRTM